MIFKEVNHLSEKWSQNLEKYLLSIQKDINKKIDQLEEKIDHIYLEQQSFLEEVGQGSQSQKRSNEKPTQKLPEIGLKKEKKEQQKVSVTTLNDASSVTAEFISKKFEESTNRILHTFREFSKGHEHSKAFEKLSDEEKKYITESNLQTIGERLDVTPQHVTGNTEAHQ